MSDKQEKIQPTCDGDIWFLDWYDGYEAIMSPLVDDMRAASCAVQRGTHEYLRRVYIRTLFATIEADVFQRKQLALIGHGKTHTFEDSELAVLREVQYNVQGSGRISETPKYIPLSANYRLSYVLAAKVIRSRFKLDCSGKEWQDFKHCIDLRNKITHPKTDSDIVVTKNDLLRAQAVASWCQKNMPKFLLDGKQGG